jgi:hypothetical protein
MAPRQRLAATARRSQVPRPARSPTQRGRPVSRLRPQRPARASPLRMRPTPRPDGCRRCPRRPHHGPGRHPRTPDPNRGPRARPAFPRASPDRRGRPSPPRTSGVRGPVRPVPPLPPRPGPARLARLARLARSARDPRTPRTPRAARAARALGPARPRRGPRDQVRPGREHPGRPSRAGHVRADRGQVRGLVTTRSARPRPAWARPLRPGPRVPFPASRVVPVSGPTAPAAQGARVVPVPAGAGQEARAVQGARVVPVREGSPVHAPVVPGRAR